MGFAHPIDLEPGMWFRTHRDGPALQWAGVKPAPPSRLTGDRRVWVLVVTGVPFIMSASKRVQLITWEKR